jgi:hypothetical protein
MVSVFVCCFLQAAIIAMMIIMGNMDPKAAWALVNKHPCAEPEHFSDSDWLNRLELMSSSSGSLSHPG